MSKENNKVKDQLLGMPHGTANNQLRKSIIFWLANLNGMLACFRCAKQIEDVDQLSIEHKVPWQSAPDPKAAFFDIGNIAFSHLRCNIGEPRRSRTECPRGHTYDLLDHKGSRSCSICIKVLDAERKRRGYSPGSRHEKYLAHGY